MIYHTHTRSKSMMDFEQETTTSPTLRRFPTLIHKFAIDLYTIPRRGPGIEATILYCSRRRHDRKHVGNPCYLVNDPAQPHKRSTITTLINLSTT